MAGLTAVAEFVNLPIATAGPEGAKGAGVRALSGGSRLRCSGRPVSFHAPVRFYSCAESAPRSGTSTSAVTGSKAPGVADAMTAGDQEHPTRPAAPLIRAGAGCSRQRSGGQHRSRFVVVHDDGVARGTQRVASRLVADGGRRGYQRVGAGAASEAGHGFVDSLCKRVNAISRRIQHER
jgi:hypothetical protein